jgi:hypothetical protein
MADNKCIGTTNSTPCKNDLVDQCYQQKVGGFEDDEDVVMKSWSSSQNHKKHDFPFYIYIRDICERLLGHL